MAFVKTESLDTPANDLQVFSACEESTGGIICKSPDKLTSLICALKAEKQLHYVSDGDWSMHDLIMQLLQQYKPAELFITTYALREFPVRQLIMAMDRKEIIAVNMLLDYRAKARTPEVYQLASMNINKIFLTSIHAKVTVIRSAKGCVTIVGSANWTQNPRIEAGVISLDESIANFHIDWITKTMDHAEIFE